MGPRTLHENFAVMQYGDAPSLSTTKLFDSKHRHHMVGHVPTKILWPRRVQFSYVRVVYVTSSRVVTDDSFLTAQVGWSKLLGVSVDPLGPGAAEDSTPLITPPRKRTT